MALTGFFCLPDAMPFAYHPLTDPTAKADFPDSPMMAESPISARCEGKLSDAENDARVTAAQTNCLEAETTATANQLW